MATMTSSPPRLPAVHERIVHPLQSLRWYIRAYVLAEGTLVSLLYLAVVFWVGLALDYGFFKLVGLFNLSWGDWIEILPPAFRAVVLGGLLLGLLAVVFFKVFTRLAREFRDRALALVLERRFPKLLGDRLITAVELADGRQAGRYGFSPAMVDQTVRDAAERVETLPVAQVFNWRRLVLQAVLLAVLTLGLYAIVLGSYCAAAGRGPVNFAVRFHHIASIWFERNVLLQEVYWPRRAHLELLAPVFADDPGNLYHNRNEPLPPVRVRAVKWVIADRPDPRRAPLGWRALRWKDLTPDLLGGLDPGGTDLRPSFFSPWPANWEETWSVDQVDVRFHKPEVAAQVNRTLRDSQAFQDAATRNKAVAVGQARLASGYLVPPTPLTSLAWLSLPTDALDEVTRVERDARLYQTVEQVLGRLEQEADSPWMERRLRKLDIPQTVVLYAKGATIRDDAPLEAREDNEFYGTFRSNIRETIRFTVNAADFFTPSKQITLVPPPRLARVTRDEYRPAYIYHRAPTGIEPAELRGKKHLFHNLDVSLSDERPQVQLPAGTDLVLHFEADKPLRNAHAEWHFLEAAEARPGAPAKKETSHVLDTVQVRDERHFEIAFDRVVRPIALDLEFTDTTGLLGRRQLLIQPVADVAPLVEVQVEVLRRTSQGYLVTAWNVVPLSGKITDDRGLSNVAYAYTVTALRAQAPDRRAVGGVAGAFQFVSSASGLVLPGYLTWLGQDLGQLARAQNKPKDISKFSLTTFAQLLRDKPADELPLGVVLPDLQRGPSLIRLEDTLTTLRTTRERINRLAQEQAGSDARTIKELDREAEPLEAALASGRRVVVDAIGGFRNIREGIHTMPAGAERLARLRDRVLQPLGESIPQKLEESEQALAAYRKALQAGSSDGSAAAQAVAHLDAALQQLADVEEAIVGLPRNGPVTEFRLDYDHNFDPDRPPRAEGFDLKERLPELKERDENRPQSHYQIQLWIEATDSNVEADRPGVGTSKETFTLLIVSENELLNDIGKEEESLRLKLEEAIALLQDVKVKLGQVSGEMASLANKKPDDFRPALQMAEESKDDVAKSNDRVREIHVDYKRILDQMKFARVRKQIVSKIEAGIVEPLDLALSREFPSADDALSDLVTTLRGANADPKAAVVAQQKVDELIARLNKAMESMKAVTTINMLIDKLVKIDKTLRAQNDILARIEEEKIKDLYKKLLEPEKK